MSRVLNYAGQPAPNLFTSIFCMFCLKKAVIMLQFLFTGTN